MRRSSERSSVWRLLGATQRYEIGFRKEALAAANNRRQDTGNGNSCPMKVSVPSVCELMLQICYTFPSDRKGASAKPLVARARASRSHSGDLTGVRRVKSLNKRG